MLEMKRFSSWGWILAVVLLLALPLGLHFLDRWGGGGLHPARESLG